MDKRILVINPGSTSTKLALFQGEQKLFDAAVRHSKEDLSPFSWVMEQADFRQTAIEKELSAHNVDLTTLDAVCARGGHLTLRYLGRFDVQLPREADYGYKLDYLMAVVEKLEVNEKGVINMMQEGKARFIPE